MRGLSPEEFQNLRLSVGTHKSNRPYSPMEVAECFDKAIRSGASRNECAQAVLVDSASTVANFLNLLKLDSKVQYLVGWGKSDVTISFYTASLLSPLNIDDQCKVSTAILAHKFTEKDIRQLRQLYKRSNSPIEECVEQVLKMRPQVYKLFVFPGTITSEKLRSYLSAITQDRRDDLLLEVIQERFPHLEEISCRLGTNRFTIVGEEDTDITLTTIEEGFESMINGLLLGRISNL